MSAEPSCQCLSWITDLIDRGKPIPIPAVLRQACVKHQVQRVFFGIGAVPEIVSKEKRRFSPCDRHAELDHHAFVGRATVDNGENSICFPDIAQIGLSDTVCPTGSCLVHLIVAFEWLPDIGPGLFQCGDQLGQRAALLLRRKPVRAGKV